MHLKKFCLFPSLLLFLHLNISSVVLSQSGDSVNVLSYEMYFDLYSNFVKPYPHSYNAYEIVTVRTESTTGKIDFNAGSYSLTIDSVSGSGISFSHENNILTVNLDKLYSPGDIIDINIYFRHKNVFDTALYVKNGMLYTDSETIGARRWFVCNDVPNDKAIFSITSRVPSNVLLGSNGLLTDSIRHGDTISYKWETKFPTATYLVVLAGKIDYKLDIDYWHRVDNPNDSIEIRYYWQTGETAFNIKNVKNKTRDILTLFSKLFGEYPFEKIGYATTDRDFPWGGMENQTLITLCPDCWTEDLAVHELSHQWFGDMISPETWPDVWLNESFATYCEALWIEYKTDYAGYHNYIAREGERYLLKNPGWAIYEKSWDTNVPDDSILFNVEMAYSKSCVVLHLLRYVLGDETFFNCLYTYSINPEFKYANISTEEFITFMSAMSGRDLRWFFDEWIYKPNHPIYQTNYNIEKISNAKWKADYTINQLQKNTVFFKMPVELLVTFSDKSDSLIKVNNGYNLQTYEFEFNKEPKKIQFDPHNEIVLKEIGK